MRCSTVALAIPVAARACDAIRIPIVISWMIGSEVQIIHPTVQTARCARGYAVLRFAHVVCNRRRLPETSVRLCVFVLVDDDDHPDAYAATRTEQRCAVYPSRPTFFVRILEILNSVWKPANFGCHATRTIGEGVAYGFAYAVRAADAVEEVRLEYTGDSKGRRCEENAQRGGRADKEVLCFVSML